MSGLIHLPVTILFNTLFHCGDHARKFLDYVFRTLYELRARADQAVTAASRRIVYRTRNGEFRYEFYDVAADPLERSDLYPSQAEELEGLRGLIELYEERARRTRARLDRGAATEPRTLLLDPRQEAKLRALGYLE